MPTSRSPMGIARAVLLALVCTPACTHATGHLPSGPPPEYEETPAPSNTSASSPVPSPATATPSPAATSSSPAPRASESPVH